MSLINKQIKLRRVYLNKYSKKTYYLIYKGDRGGSSENIVDLIGLNGRIKSEYLDEFKERYELVNDSSLMFPIQIQL